MTIYLVLAMAAFVLAYANGANDNFKATATVYGSGALPYKRALKLATLAQLSGSVASLFLAAVLVKAFSGKGLVPDEVVADPVFRCAVGAGAALAVLLATRFGLPVSTTHALIGGLAGAGMATAPAAMAWGALGGKYFLPLLLSPLLAVTVTAGLYPLARALRKRLGIEASSCICVEQAQAVPQAEGALILHAEATALTLSADHRCSLRYQGAVFGISAQQAADTLHKCSAFSLGFARGLNDTPKIMGILAVAALADIDSRFILALVALFMAAGGLLHSRRLAETVGKHITPMNTGQGLLANLVSSSLVIGASLLGSPVSTTHISTGSIFGIGFWTGRTDWKLAGGIVLAWAATLPLGAALAYGFAVGLARIAHRIT